MLVGKVPWVAPGLEKAPRVRALVPGQVPVQVLARAPELVPEQETRWVWTWAQNCPLKMGR